jgi:hypothetical protein
MPLRRLALDHVVENQRQRGSRGDEALAIAVSQGAAGHRRPHGFEPNATAVGAGIGHGHAAQFGSLLQNHGDIVGPEGGAEPIAAALENNPLALGCFVADEDHTGGDDDRKLHRRGAIGAGHQSHYGSRLGLLQEFRQGQDGFAILDGRDGSGLGHGWGGER